VGSGVGVGVAVGSVVGVGVGVASAVFSDTITIVSDAAALTVIPMIIAATRIIDVIFLIIIPP
jgi:hypothetical protein